MGDLSEKGVATPSELSYDAHDLRDNLPECLDKLGYSEVMVYYRRNANKNMDEIYNGKAYPFYSITSGSKGEGTALYYESDIDRLYKVKGVVCLESDQQTACPVVFTMIRNGSAHGYTRLKLKYGSCAKIDKYIVSEEDSQYISNDFTAIDPDLQMTDINGVRILKQDKTGPASPFGNRDIRYDFVCGFKCISQDISERWITRPRPYGWPDAELLKNIASLHGFVVPVANKETRYPQTEWRICYTKAEMLLIESLNGFQTKLYILLKHIAKSVLKPICSEMSSYIMKNILFWMVETKPKECFTGLNLIDGLIDGLVFLKECLRTNTLMSYMIEDRNLLQGRVTDEERIALIKELDFLINEKENMLKRCDKIWLGFLRLNRNQERFSEEAAKRNEIEQLVLKKNIIFKEVEKPEGHLASGLLSRLESNEMYRKYNEDLHRLILPDIDQIVTSGQEQEQVFRNRLSTILS